MSQAQSNVRYSWGTRTILSKAPSTHVRTSTWRSRCVPGVVCLFKPIGRTNLGGLHLEWQQTSIFTLFCTTGIHSLLSTQASERQVQGKKQQESKAQKPAVVRCAGFPQVGSSNQPGWGLDTASPAADACLREVAEGYCKHFCQRNTLSHRHHHQPVCRFLCKRKLAHSEKMIHARQGAPLAKILEMSFCNFWLSPQWENFQCCMTPLVVQHWEGGGGGGTWHPNQAPKCQNNNRNFSQIVFPKGKQINQSSQQVRKILNIYVQSDINKNFKCKIFQQFSPFVLFFFLKIVEKLHEKLKCLRTIVILNTESKSLINKVSETNQLLLGFFFFFLGWGESYWGTFIGFPMTCKQS